MATLTVTLPTGTTIVNGKQITFRAPCDCTGISGIVINGTTYTLVDATTEQITGHTFKKDAMVSVIMDTENNKAFVQNGIIYGVSTVELTRAEYDALVAAGLIDKNTIYVVSDGEDSVGAKILTGSYTGTGSAGDNNPNSLTFDFAPIMVILIDYYGTGSSPTFTQLYGASENGVTVMYRDALTTSYAQNSGFSTGSTGYGKRSEDGRTIYWYNTNTNSSNQYNASGFKYYYLAIG